MVLALNKDLERSIRDKERYKKKLRELQGTATTSSNGGSIHSIRRAEQLILDQDRPGSNLSNYPGRNPAENSPLQMHQTKQAETMLALRNAAAASSASQPVPPPARRPPPAPINIDQAARVRPNIEVETGRDRDSNSEYEDADILPEDEIPTFERGRRKTREDDDRHSAALMVQEQEARSRSNKKKAKSIDPPATVQQGQTQQGFHGMGLPSSPRAMLFGQPGPASPWRGAIYHLPSPCLR
ncbi:hypothetical protein CISG_10301 [Coccidioides immitis RMSCC 3703]|uniref:Uncharacterized protein n=1 Tax=Coccidioides immitis RMSCC 3703 TaxID=454286 RepID=A0A0J8QP09_COCIT|nr:hypothetical protein CISG_10301 [Coccidioides immitis RMSCC 3703]